MSSNSTAREKHSRKLFVLFVLLLRVFCAVVEGDVDVAEEGEEKYVVGVGVGGWWLEVGGW